MKWIAGVTRALLVMAFVLPASAVPITESQEAVAADTVVDAGAVELQPQAQEAPDEDDRVPVQVWTMIAAAGAAVVGLVGFAIRWKLGRVAPPPEQPGDAHH